jgi:hypothetical protein
VLSISDLFISVTLNARLFYSAGASRLGANPFTVADCIGSASIWDGKGQLPAFERKRPPTEAASNPTVNGASSQQLLLAVFLHVNLGSFVGVMHGVKRMPPCGMCMMRRFFVMTALMMFCCFAVVTRGVRMVFC